VIPPAETGRFEMMQGLMTALIIKHFVSDFLLQTPYQYKNKGIFLHPGGLLHGVITIASTAVVLVVFKVPVSLWPTILVVEFLVHYGMDFAKVRLNQRMGWTASTHNQFYILLGFDQMVHYLTYIWIVYWVTLQVA
jgi:hypothetical protein